MRKTPKKNDAPLAISEALTEFDVGSGGTLRMSGYREAETRADFYEDVADDWSGSPLALAEAMDRCQPLAWAVQSIYSDSRDELASDLAEAQKAGKGHKKRIAALQARLNRLPEEPEDGAEGWLIGLTSREFEDWVVPEIEQWFEQPPNWSFEDDYLPETCTAQGAALEFFRSEDSETLDILGVRIVEGDRPGSSYYAAELVREVGAANAAAVTNGIPVRFLSSQSVETKTGRNDAADGDQLPSLDPDGHSEVPIARDLKAILNSKVSGGSFTEHHVLPSGTRVSYSFSQATGLGSVQAAERYKAEFGEIPRWVVVSHPAHRRQFFDWALLNETPLPSSAP
jgi:hypothetical protein